jgi:hypothetical protein
MPIQIMIYSVQLFLLFIGALQTGLGLQSRINSGNSNIPISVQESIDLSNCSFNGIELKGKVKIVKNFADIKIQFVDHFPDIKVKVVDHFPDDCGEWKWVDNFPDFTVEIVDQFPDLKVKRVDHFPGID